MSDLPCGCRTAPVERLCQYHQAEADLSGGTFASPESVRSHMHIVKADSTAELVALLANFKPPPGLTDWDVARACLSSHKYGKAEGAAEATAAIVAWLRAEPGSSTPQDCAEAIEAGAHMKAKP